MLTTIKRSLYALSNKLRRQSGPMKEKWTADFSKPEKSCFNIKPEISFNAYLEKGSLFLGLKKRNLFAWLETASRVYVDQVINARFRLNSFGNYCSTGIMFRVMGRGTYYLALVSSKGYFRLDAVKNGVPDPLIGWTETPGFNEQGVNLLTVTAKGDHLIFILNGRWIAEAHDNSVPGGHLGFPLVSYDPDRAENGGGDTPPDTTGNRYSCQAWLEFLSVDSRAGAVEAEYKKWKDSPEITAESRLRLAESLSALNRTSAAYDQLIRAWKQREEAARSVSATYTEMRSSGELFLAARLSGQLGRFAAAEEYINTCLAMGTEDGGDNGSFDITAAFAEKAKILSSQNKFAELAAFLPEYINFMKENSPAGLPALYALLGHAYRNLKDYEAAAEAWDTAFSLNRNSGLYAVSAANAYELAGRDDTALQRRLSAGKIFLQQEDFAELGALIPKLLAAGEKNPEVRLLAAQYASATGGFAEVTPPKAVVAEGNLGSVEPVCRVPEKPAEKVAPAEPVEKTVTITPAAKKADAEKPVTVTKETPPVKKPVAKKAKTEKPVTEATEPPPAKKPAKAKTVTKEKKPATETKKTPSVKKPVTKKTEAVKPATKTKETPPVKKPVTKKAEATKPAVKTKAKPTAKAVPAKTKTVAKTKATGAVKKGKTGTTSPVKPTKTAAAGKTVPVKPKKAAVTKKPVSPAKSAKATVAKKTAKAATAAKTKPAAKTGKTAAKKPGKTAVKKTATAKAAKPGTKTKPAAKKPVKTSE